MKKALILPFVLAASCAATVPRGEKAKMNDENAAEILRARASFIMQCPQEQLELTVLAIYEGKPVAAGVRGCGVITLWQRVLANGDNSWMLNSPIVPLDAKRAEMIEPAAAIIASIYVPPTAPQRTQTSPPPAGR